MVEHTVGMLAERGYATIPDAIDAEQVAWAREDLEKILISTPSGRGDFEGHRTRRVYALFAKTRSLDALALHPTVLAVLDRVLGAYQLSAPTGISIGPGEKAQPLHPDDAIYPLPRPHDEVVVNVMWPLQDFTEENGATRVVLGSNHAADRLSFGTDDTEPAVMGRGSVLLYSGSVYHGGGANRSAETRLGLNITYNVAWLRQEENQYLSCPREVAETLPTELLRLMGYDRGAYALGYIDDLRDPIEAVRPGVGSTGFGLSEASGSAGNSG